MLDDSQATTSAVRQTALTVLAALGLVALAGLSVWAAGVPRSAAAAAPLPPSMRAAAALVAHGEEALRSDPDASRKDAQDALRLLTQAPDTDTDLEVRAHLLLCDYQSEHDMAAAQREVAAATALLPKVRRAGLRAGVILCEGGILETAGESTKALERYRRAVALATTLKDEDMLAEGQYQLGYMLGVKGDYANGLLQLRQAERLFEKLGKPLHQLAALNSVAILYNRIGEYAEAQSMYTRALAQQQGSPQRRDLAVTLYNLGRADENLHDWGAAQEAYSQSLTISTGIDYPRAQGYALRGLAAVANAAGDGQKALDTLARADTALKDTQDARLHALIQLERGIALHHLARLIESAKVLEEAAQTFRQAEARGELVTTLSELATVYSVSGNWRAAYERQTAAKSLSDQLLRNQIDLRFAALKVEFDTAAKDKEVAVLKRANIINAQALARGRSLRQLQLAVIALLWAVLVLAVVLALAQLRATRRLRVLAMTDELTAVPNRRAVLTRLETLLSSTEADTSILIVDIDHFKRINDIHGHPVGDEVLKLVAQRLAAAVRPPSYFGRLGGEEFLVVLPATDLSAAREAAEGLRCEVASTELTRLACSERGGITVSIGATTTLARDESPSALLRRADLALYAAKNGGRNCVMTEP